MNISKVAKATGLTAKTIRYYESIGLISAPVRSDNGYRSYTEGALREQVWRYFALWNFDDQEAAPYWLLDATPAEDMAAAEKARGERAKTVLDIARALTAFDKAGVLDKVDVPRLLEAAGVPLREGGEQGGGVLGGQVPDPAAAGAAPGPGAGQEPLGGVASELDPDPAR